MFVTHYLLSLLIWIPITGGVYTLAVEKILSGKKKTIFSSVIFISIITILLACILYLDFDYTNANLQFVENISWFSLLSGNESVVYKLGVDGFSVLFIILSSFSNLVIILFSFLRSNTKCTGFFLIITGLTNGIFCAQDTILFYFFWEILLIPTTLGIGIWGNYRRKSAAIKYFFYSFFGSVFLLLALLYIHQQVALLAPTTLPDADTFSIHNFIYWATQVDRMGHLINITVNIQWFLFGALFLAFAIKFPIWPLHSWLPELHLASPIGGSVALMILMVKPGVYGIFRFLLPILPTISIGFDWFLVSISLITIIYAGIVAIAQTNLKSLIAYSSISHMGLIMLAISSVFLLINNNSDRVLGIADAQLAIQGAIFQAITYAFSSGGMFIGCNYLHTRLGTNNINDIKGLAHSMPVFSIFFMLFCISNIGFPGTTGFVGEFLIILSVFKYSPLVAFFAAFTLILSPVYTLWMYKRVFFGTASYKNGKTCGAPDINIFEMFILSLMLIPIIVFGIYPEPILKVSSFTSTNIINAAHMITIG